MTMCFNGIPKRYILSILVFWGFFTMYALRTNLNVAIGAMVKNHTVFIDGVETYKVIQLSLTSVKQFIHEMVLWIYKILDNLIPTNYCVVLYCIYHKLEILYYERIKTVKSGLLKNMFLQES